MSVARLEQSAAVQKRTYAKHDVEQVQRRAGNCSLRVGEAVPLVHRGNYSKRKLKLKCAERKNKSTSGGKKQILLDKIVTRLIYECREERCRAT